MKSSQEIRTEAGEGVCPATGNKIDCADDCSRCPWFLDSIHPPDFGDDPKDF